MNPELAALAKIIGLIVGVSAIVGGVYVIQPASPTTYSTTFAFDPSPSTNVAYYKVIWGGSTNTYTNILNIGSNLIFTIKHNEPDCHAMVCAVDSFGNESEWSNPAGVYRRGTTDTVFAQTNANLASNSWSDAFKVASVTNSTGSLFYRLRIERENRTTTYP